ncbi:MAG TPA: hypothetical protein ENF21_01290 [Bacteroidetes bacterium]|nr:hypothetical protein [Bacteroidota bacterium]
MKNLLVVLTGIMTGCWFTVSAQEIPDTSLTGEEEYYVVTLSGTRLFEDMENLSSVLMIIPANEKVRIFSEFGDYYLAEYEGVSGYIRIDQTRFTEETEKMVKEAWAREHPEEVSRQEVSVDGTREEILVKRYGREVGEKIARGAIWRGMNRSMVYDSWGKPLNIDRYHELDKTIEVWSYRNVVLYFENGELNNWRK